MIQYSGLLVALASASCGSGEARYEHASLASLEFTLPAQWKKDEPARPSMWKGELWKLRGLETAQWTPLDNERRESIVIMRSERSPVVAKAGASALEALLAAAQRSLPGARASKATPFKTVRGLAGARIELDFRPPGKSERYHRVHVVLADEKDGSLVHVLYTAHDPDRDLTALSAVLDSIHHEEG